ncbi:MAG: polymer-forming cytoskeletal protein [Patescibacteria group bacterium]
MKRTGILVILVIAVLLLPAVSLAKNINQTDVYLPKDKIIEGNYYAAGATVEVAGKVTSDVMAVGGSVVISGEVAGDVLVIGGNVRITGSVEGNVRIIGGNIELAGPVGKNVSVVGGTLTIATSSQISGHLSLAVGAFDLRGSVLKDVNGAVGNFVIAGTIKGKTDLKLDPQSISQIRDTAIIQGPFSYQAKHEVQVASGAKLSEPLRFIPYAPKAVSHSGWWLKQLISLFSLLVVALVIISLAPKLVQQISQEALVKPWKKIGWGFVWLVVPPIVFIILLVTVIGIPLGIIFIVCYAIGLYLTQVFAGMALGEYLKTKKPFAWMQKLPLLLVASIGILVFKLLTLVPYIGWLIILVALLWMWGTIIQVKKDLLNNYR